MATLGNQKENCILKANRKKLKKHIAPVFEITRGRPEFRRPEKNRTSCLDSRRPENPGWFSLAKDLFLIHTI